MVVTAGAAGPADSSSQAEDALRAIFASQDDLDCMRDTLVNRMSELHALQDTFEKAVGKHEKAIRTFSAAHPQPPALPSSLPPREPAHVDDPSHLPKPEEKPLGPDRENPVRDLAALRDRLKHMQLLMPSTGGMFVETFLGSINVRFVRKSERLAFKKDYEMLKLKLAPVFVVFCIICLILKEYRWLHMILQLSLTSYYVVLAIRENILRANGSNIRAWWIIHHYFTMMQGVLLLTWPNGISYARFRQRLHLFGLYNAILMIFQTRYQMARLYTLRSLGRAHEMDVASSDSTQIHWSETMSLLLPLIVLGQIMQGYQALTLFTIYKEFPSELQILLLSILFTANFIGNSTTTMQVLVAKRKVGKCPPTSVPSLYPPTHNERSTPNHPEVSVLHPLTREEEKKTA